MLIGNRSWEEWVSQYSASHQNGANKLCHLCGIPLIALSLVLAPVLFLDIKWWKLLAAMFCFGWILQFAGHAFEGKPPEFIKDPRFLLVGMRWWIAKVRTSSRAGNRSQP